MNTPKRFRHTSLVVLAALVAVLLFAATFSYSAWREVQAGQEALSQAQAGFGGVSDVARVEDQLVQAAGYFRSAHFRFRFVRPLRFVPGAGRYVRAASELIEGASVGVDALAEAVGLAQEVFAPFERVGKVEVGKLSVEERQRLLTTLESAVPKLKGVQDKVRGAHALFASAKKQSGGVDALRSAASQAVEQFGTLQAVLDDAVPLLEVIPAVAGFPEPKAYLFLLQNSDEMRPTGGFIGTFGVLTLETGHITNFLTDDVYNLDRFVPGAKRPPSPEPLRRYLQQPHFYLRDANWSPDFPESARRVVQFYGQEREFAPPEVREATPPAGNLAGVIAIMPQAIRPLLELVGPLRVDGQTFNAQNLTDLLEYQVEIGFQGQGIPRPQRKAIIAELGHALIAKVFTLPTSRWPEILHLVRSSFDEKHILLYAVDPKVEALVQQNGWAGNLPALSQAPSDYLAVFDANMFSLKTDPYVERAISYAVESTSVGVIGTVELTYFYPKPGPYWKTKGYRTWTRVYVPSGSVLVEAAGAMEEEESIAPGRVTIEQEFDKTVFGAFLAVQVGERKTLRFTYRLPPSVVKRVESGAYELVVQKQPGTLGHPLTVTADFGKVPASWSPTGLNVARQGSTVRWQTSLRRDQTFKLKFE